jgi:hypothetical protein
MPEATINLHCDASAGEHNVRTTREAFHIHPIAQASSMEFSADGEFGLCADGPLPGHEGGHLRAGCRRSISGAMLRGHKYKHDPTATGTRAGVSTCGASGNE